MSTNVKMQLLAGLDSNKMTTGERVCRITYKAKSKEEVRRNSVGCFLPVITTSEQEKLLAVPAVRQWVGIELAKLQDSLVRAYMDSNSYVVANGVPSTEYDTSALEVHIGQLVEGASERTRLSGDAIRTWCAEVLNPVLAEVFAGKLGTSAADKKVLGIVAAYQQNMAMLAGNSKMEDAQLENLVKALDLVVDADTSGMSEKLLKRIEVLSTPVVIDMMAL